MTRKVLLVDRDADAAGMYRVGLEHAGFEVDVADSADALPRALASPVDAIVMEWEHLGRTGPELVHLIHTRLTPRAVPVLVLSNQDGDVTHLQKQALKAGAQGWLIKARTTPTDLVQRLEAAIQSSEHAET